MIYAGTRNGPICRLRSTRAPDWAWRPRRSRRCEWLRWSSQGSIVAIARWTRHRSPGQTRRTVVTRMTEHQHSIMIANSMDPDRSIGCRPRHSTTRSRSRTHHRASRPHDIDTANDADIRTLRWRPTLIGSANPAHRAASSPAQDQVAPNWAAPRTSEPRQT